jgi:hypothetical protein
MKSFPVPVFHDVGCIVISLKFITLYVTSIFYDKKKNTTGKYNILIAVLVLIRKSILIIYKKKVSPFSVFKSTVAAILALIGSPSGYSWL